MLYKVCETYDIHDKDVPCLEVGFYDLNEAIKYFITVSDSYKDSPKASVCLYTLYNEDYLKSKKRKTKKQVKSE